MCCELLLPIELLVFFLFTLLLLILEGVMTVLIVKIRPDYCSEWRHRYELHIFWLGRVERSLGVLASLQIEIVLFVISLNMIRPQLMLLEGLLQGLHCIHDASNAL
jgi:hypothetical protein